ncbi:MAG: DUF4440 domain-containing protein [Acidobacteria bacterium]|nr:DUF4440 domain-containing protein [Acidobacteriota bacterium]
MRMHGPGLLVFTIVCLAGAVPARAQPAARQAIEAANSRFSEALAAGRAAELAGMYTEDARVFPPGGDVVQGQAAIQKLWQGVIDSGVKGLVLTTADVEPMGDAAHESGTFVMTDGAGRVVDRGKYVVVWKREQARWKLHRDIWNALPPVAR